MVYIVFFLDMYLMEFDFFIYNKFEGYDGFYDDIIIFGFNVRKVGQKFVDDNVLL